MWSLQRQNKEPEKKWRFSGPSRSASLLRRPTPKDKENVVINYRTLDRVTKKPSDAFIDPRTDPRFIRTIRPESRQVPDEVPTRPTRPLSRRPSRAVRGPTIEAPRQRDRSEPPPGVLQERKDLVAARQLNVQRYLNSIQKESGGTTEMVSRRQILSRSRDLLYDEDIWDNVDVLLKDHIHEVLRKWEQIDDEVWAKVIVFEKNRRIAKAYVRSPVLTINGTNIGFDGFRIGLSGFENPVRDAKTEELINRHIGLGVKVRMDEEGNILVKRLSKANVYVKPTSDENAINPDVMKLPNTALEFEKPVKAFDLTKFEQNVDKELKRTYPNRAKLEMQCIFALSFVRNGSTHINCPSWVMIINMVAMDMLKSKLPIAKLLPNIKNRPRFPPPEEDPYSIMGSGASSGGSSGKEKKDKPPKLPPRDIVPPAKTNGTRNDYDGVTEDGILPRFRFSKKNNKEKEKTGGDDPYYSGLRARIPNFAKSKSKEKNNSDLLRSPYSTPNLGINPMMYHTRSFESGMDSELTESPYAHLYGRVPASNRGYVPPPTSHGHRAYSREWE